MEEKNNIIKKYKYELLLILVAAIWGFGFVAGKMCLSSLTPMSTMALRFCGSSLGLFVIFYKRILKADKLVIKYGALVGLTQILAQGLQLIGLQFTTSAKQSFLITSYVILAPFVSWIVLKKRPRLKAFICGLASFVGLGLICITDDFTIAPGDIISLASAVVFALQVILISKYMHQISDGLLFSFFQILTAGIGSLIICIFTEPLSISFCTESTIGILYLILFNTMVAFVIQSKSQKHVSDVKSSLLLSLESVFGLAFSVIYYNDSLGLRMYLGSLICFISAFISTAEHEKNN